MKRYKLKTIQEVKGTRLASGELSENDQLLEDLIERFQESERRTKADNQKRQSYIENKKKRAQEMRKKQWKRSGEMKVTLGINAMQKVQFRSCWFSSRKT